MPAWDEATVAAAARRLRLATDPRQRRQGDGTRLGRGPGASLEFHDHRTYAPGDDLRHLDWSAYARSGQLMIRRQRKEVSPRLEVLLDLSASMAITPAKAALATALAALFASLAQRDGGRPRLWALRGTAQGLSADWRQRLRQLDCAGATLALPALTAGSERVLISDGLHQQGAPPIVRALGAEAGSLSLVQVLTRAEQDPGQVGAVRLVDVEGGEADLVVDGEVLAGYRQRLARLQLAWRDALRGRGAGLVTIAVEDGLEAAVRALVRCGLLNASAGGA